MMSSRHVEVHVLDSQLQNNAASVCAQKDVNNN